MDKTFYTYTLERNENLEWYVKLARKIDAPPYATLSTLDIARFDTMSEGVAFLKTLPPPNEWAEKERLSLNMTQEQIDGIANA